MSTQTTDDLDDMLPDELTPKGSAVPVVRTPAQKAAQARANAKAQAAALAQNNAVRLAQIVNLHIAGFSLADIGAQIGATPEEVDRLITSDAARYVRNQPALRAYVRNWISSKYMKMIEADWDHASDESASDKLEHQDRVMRMLDRMAKLHGAEMPTQSEVKVDAAPEAVERLVNALANGRGLGYNVDIFDVPPEDIHEAVVVSEEATEVSGNAAGQPQEGDPDEGF